MMASMASLLFMPLKMPELTSAAVALVGALHRGGVEPLALGLDRDDDGQAELAGELEVPLVVGGDCHDRARPVFCEDEVAHEDGHLLLREGVYRVSAREDAFFFQGKLGPEAPVLGLRLLDEGGDLGLVDGPLGKGRSKRVLRGEHHEGDADKACRALS